MNYSGLSLCDLASGPGARVSLFVSGCTVRCPNCYNPEAWDFNYGKPFDDQTKQKIIDRLKNDYIAGVSILGGDPLEPENIETVTEFCKQLKQLYPNKSIWLWTGRTKHKVENLPIMQYIDVVCSEPYVDKLKCNGHYYGSSNQKVWWAKTKQPYDDCNMINKHSTKDWA